MALIDPSVARQIQQWLDVHQITEIDGLIRFYESEAGHAYIRKMPVVMQQSAAMMQERVAPLMQQLKSSIEEAVMEQRRAQQQGKPANR